MKSIIYTPFLLTLIIFITFSNLADVNSKEEIICPKLENTVSIDGRWTSNKEWADAIEGELSFVSGLGKVYFRMKHDEESLFLLIDYVSLINPQERDAAGIMIDTKNDEGSIMQKDDYFLGNIYVSDETAWTVRVWGTGNRILEDLSDLDWTLVAKLDWELEPEGFLVHSSNDVDNDPYSTEPHMIWEFKIPKSEFQSVSIGFLTFVINLGGETGACYPILDIDTLDSPELWAKLEFSHNTLAQIEYSSVSAHSTTTTITMTGSPKTQSGTIKTTIPAPITNITDHITVSETTGEESKSYEKTEKAYWEFVIIGLLIVAIILFVTLLLRKRGKKSLQ